MSRIFRRRDSTPTTLKEYWAGEVRDLALLQELERRRESLASVDGRHYTEHVEPVKMLRRAGEDEKAEALLLRLVIATEAEAQFTGHGVAPWYFEQLAIIYRKRKDAAAELHILERFAAQQHAPGATPGKLMERLESVRRSASGRS